MCTSICSVWIRLVCWPQLTVQCCSANVVGIAPRRKRIKKGAATADGEPIEDAAKELEDSDAEDEGDASFIQSDEG